MTPFVKQLKTVLAEALLELASAPQPESSPSLALSLTAAMGLQEVQEQGLLGAIGESPCLSPGQKQHEGWGAAEEEEVLCRVHRKGVLQTLGTLLLQGFDKGIKFSDILLMHGQLLW